MHELRKQLEAFSSLHTAKVKGHRTPHKAVLLLAVIDLIEENAITGPEIELTEQLVERFDAIWNRYLGMSSIFTPDICKPYFHMQHEPFWCLVKHEEATMLLAAEPSLQVASNKEKKRLPVGSYSVKAMRSTFAYAEIDHTLYLLLRNADARAMLRVVLINTYLSNQPTKTLPDLATIIKNTTPKTPKQQNNWEKEISDFKLFLKTQTSNFNKPFSQSTVNVYASSLVSEEMQKVVESIIGGKSIFEIKKIATIKQIIEYIRNTENVGFSKGPVISAICLYEKYITLSQNKKGLVESCNKSKNRASSQTQERPNIRSPKSKEIKGTKKQESNGQVRSAHNVCKKQICIFKKNVDYSIFSNGTIIPIGYHRMMQVYLGHQLIVGRSEKITLIYNDKNYEVYLVMPFMKGRTGKVMQLLWQDSEFSKAVQSDFYEAFEFLKQVEKTGSKELLPNQLSSIFVLYGTNVNGTYIVEIDSPDGSPKPKLEPRPEPEAKALLQPKVSAKTTISRYPVQKKAVSNEEVDGIWKAFLSLQFREKYKNKLMESGIAKEDAAFRMSHFYNKVIDANSIGVYSKQLSVCKTFWQCKIILMNLFVAWQNNLKYPWVKDMFFDYLEFLRQEYSQRGNLYL